MWPDHGDSLEGFPKEEQFCPKPERWQRVGIDQAVNADTQNSAVTSFDGYGELISPTNHCVSSVLLLHTCINKHFMKKELPGSCKFNKNKTEWGAWVAQYVKHPALGSSSGHVPTVCGLGPHTGLCADSMESAWDSLFIPLKINK